MKICQLVLSGKNYKFSLIRKITRSSAALKQLLQFDKIGDPILLVLYPGGEEDKKQSDQSEFEVVKWRQNESKLKH